MLVSLHKYPNVLVCVEIDCVSGLIAFNRDSADRTGVDAAAAQDAAVGYAGAAVWPLTLHHNTARGAGTNAATAADAGFAIDNQSAHLCHPLDNLGKLCRLLGRFALNGFTRLIAVGHK